MFFHQIPVAQIIAPCKTLVLFVEQDLHPVVVTEKLCQLISGTIGRSVVHDHNLITLGVYMPFNGFDTIQRLLHGAVVQDHESDTVCHSVLLSVHHGFLSAEFQLIRIMTLPLILRRKLHIISEHAL